MQQSSISEPASQLTRLTAHQLQAARAQSVERFTVVGIAILKEAGVPTWEFRDKRGLTGFAKHCSQHVVCPPPTTRRRLAVLAHEAGHVALGHVVNKTSPVTRHRAEFEAWQYAIAALRRHGIAFPVKELINAKKSVAYVVEKAVRRNATALDRETVKWCEEFIRPREKSQITIRGIKLVAVR